LVPVVGMTRRLASSDRKWSALRRWIRYEHDYYINHSLPTLWLNGEANAQRARLLREVLDHMTDQLADERRRRRKAR
jgi:hypothetical protein